MSLLDRLGLRFRTAYGAAKDAYNYLTDEDSAGNGMGEIDGIVYFVGKNVSYKPSFIARSMLWVLEGVVDPEREPYVVFTGPVDSVEGSYDIEANANALKRYHGVDQNRVYSVSLENHPSFIAAAGEALHLIEKRDLPHKKLAVLADPLDVRKARLSLEDNDSDITYFSGRRFLRDYPSFREIKTQMQIANAFLDFVKWCNNYDGINENVPETLSRDIGELYERLTSKVPLVLDKRESYESGENRRIINDIRNGRLK